jgi:rhodanese-related sulfurtransferase
MLVPLATLPSRVHELPREREVVLVCHHGARSQQALHFLRAQGFTRLMNLTGGIDQWSVLVDPSVPRY